MTIVFRFKDGFELPVECEYFKCDVHPVTGLISGYKISGITNNKPLYLRMEDIVCIWRKEVSGDDTDLYGYAKRLLLLSTATKPCNFQRRKKKLLQYQQKRNSRPV